MNMNLGNLHTWIVPQGHFIMTNTPLKYKSFSHLKYMDSSIYFILIWGFSTTTSNIGS